MVNLVLFAYGFVNYAWNAQHVQRPLRPNLSVHPSSKRSLLAKDPPKPCVCTYSVEDGQMVKNTELPSPPLVAPYMASNARNKVGQDVVEGEDFQVGWI